MAQSRSLPTYNLDANKEVEEDNGILFWSNNKLDVISK